mmetsp:Transcript_11176/g.28278  ORF Transcript_11176/g.28278 Transcript_11176/m.28278 type:complete len:282 (+) Transcript_11176:65-910(+)
MASSSGRGSQGAESARAELAERYLLAREFREAHETALETLEGLDHGELGSDAAVRLSYVLCQALFETQEDPDAERTLRKVYGSYLAIPDKVATLWLALLIIKGQEDKLLKFAQSYMKVHKNRLSEIDGGSFVTMYVIDVLCELCREPDKARTWLETNLSDLKDSDFRDGLEEKVVAFAERISQEEEAKSGVGDGECRDVAEKHCETKTDRDSTNFLVVDRIREGYVALSDYLGSTDKSTLILGSLVTTTFLYALVSERRTLCGMSRRTWNRITGGKASSKK